MPPRKGQCLCSKWDPDCDTYANRDGRQVYRKWDRPGSRHFFDGAREKVASDLAQILGVNVPATLLWTEGGEYGCVQEEPPHFNQTLDDFVRATKSAPPDESAPLVERLRSVYDPIFLFFDVWVANHDRALNNGNCLISENRTQVIWWLIDYSLSLGHRERPWGHHCCDRHGFGPGSPIPLPQVVAAPSWIETALSRADDCQKRIEAVDDESVRHICSRAFGIYGVGETSDLVERISSCLICRKPRGKTWTLQLLGA